MALKGPPANELKECGPVDDPASIIGELLAMLKDLVDHPELDWAEELVTPREKFMRARALIKRIEGTT